MNLHRLSYPVSRVSVALFIATAALLATGCGSTDPGKPLENLVSMPKDISVPAGQRFAVPVYFENTDPIAAVSLPLRFNAAVMRCDSVSYVGSRCSTFMFQLWYARHDTIQIGVVDTTGVGRGGGLLATLHFWAFGNAPETDVEIDLFDLPLLEFGYADTSLTFDIIKPRFESGRVHIKTQL